MTHLLNGQSSVIIEAGHLYDAIGQTQWSVVGWKLLAALGRQDDMNVLLVDNIHGEDKMFLEEKVFPEGYIKRTDEEDGNRMPYIWDPQPDFVIKESELLPEALASLFLLRRVNAVYRHSKKSEKWFYEDWELTDDYGTPRCLLYDVGFSYWKGRHMGDFVGAVNILPHFYEEEQKKLLALFNHLVVPENPDWKQEVILFDLDGTYWYLGETEKYKVPDLQLAA